MNKTITVIVPVYNGEEYIEKCIEQLDNQTLNNVEIIIVDDGSTDRTYELACKYKLHKQTIKIIRVNHIGVSNARNTGINASTGEYITFVDVDDEYDLDMLETYYSVAKHNDSDVVCIEKNKGFNNYNLSNYEVIKKLLCDEISMSCCNKAFRKTICDNMFDINIKIYEDYLSLYTALTKAKTVTIISGEKYHYIQRENSSSRAKVFSEKYFDAIKVVNFTYESINEKYPGLIEYAMKRKYNTYLRIIKIYYLRNGYKSSEYNSKISDIYNELKKINKKDLKIIFNKKTELVRYRVLMTNKTLFKLLVKTIDKK